MEYIKEDNTVVYKCLLCYREAPYQYPIYGRQQPNLKVKREKKVQYGREVA